MFWIKMYQPAWPRSTVMPQHTQALRPGQLKTLKMLYHFLMNSVTTEFTTKLVLYKYQKEYTMNGAPIDTCLFKKIIQLTYVDTMATASHIRKTLMDMHLKLPTFQHDWEIQ